MREDVKISVIVPAYNAEKTLNKCVDSILQQTYDNIELIIVNDGSTDNTKKICNEYAAKDKRVVVINNSNHGVSYSRNYGIKIATGDYITFVDSDDYLDKECYEKIAKIFSENIDVIRYNFRLDGKNAFNNNLYDLKDRKIELKQSNMNILYQHFLTFNEPIPNLVMLLVIKQDIAKKLCFNEKLYMMEDVVFYINMFSEIKNIYFADLKLYNYYVNENSVTHSTKNYYKNIKGILDTSSIILSKLSNVLNINQICEIKGNHLRIISHMLIFQYRSSKSEFKKILTELSKKEDFIELIEFYKFTPIKNRIFVYLMKNKNYILMYIYLWILDITYKIMGR